MIDSDQQRRSTKKLTKKTIKTLTVKNKANQKIVDQFEKLIAQIKYDLDRAESKNDSMKNFYRLRQINNALKIIQNYPDKIIKGEDLQGIKGIGKGTIDRINEIIKTNKLKEVKVSKKHEKYLEAIEELEQVHGIGRKTAYLYVSKYKIRSVDQLKKAIKNGKIVINDQVIKMGLKYHGIFKDNIPRAEMNEIDDLIHKIIPQSDVETHAVTCGSYRREKLFSNDIDILLVHPQIKTKKDLDEKDNKLIKAVKELKRVKFLIDDLTFEDFHTKYMGFCQLSKNHHVRRIDIKYVPYRSYYSALLHFTGSGVFNAKMRGVAQSLGYKLNEYGLFKLTKIKTKTEVVIRRKRIPIKSEKDIFDELDMEYIPPNKR